MSSFRAAGRGCGRAEGGVPCGREGRPHDRRVRHAADRPGHRGKAYADGIGFAVPELPSGRESFSPDASYYTGTLPANRMRFVEGAPDFAVEVRSKNDYGPAAELETAEKRADYFLAGTRAVWDVDPVAGIVMKYTAADPTNPTTFDPGQEADAEPAAPGWRPAVDALFA